MRPNTPHIAVALENSIIFGGHFYSFPNMQDTLSGMVHSLVLGDRVTGTTAAHPGDTRFLLFRMLQYLYKFFVKGTDRLRESN